MRPKPFQSKLNNLLFVAFATVLLGGLWWLLSQQYQLAQPAAAATSAPTDVGLTPTVSGYPGPGATEAGTELPPISMPVATPTLWPAKGPILSNVQNLNAKAQLGLGTGLTPTFIGLSTDGKTIVGEVVTSQQKPFAGYVVTIDIASGVTEKIADVTTVASPQVSDQFVVWIEKDKLNFYDRTSGKQGVVDIGIGARNPSLAGSVVVWESLPDNSAPGFQIWGYDLATGKDFVVIKEPGKASPIISGRWVVYTNLADNNDTSIGLEATNLDTNAVLSVGRLVRAGRITPPLYAIDAPWIVWSSGQTSDKPAIHLYNLDTQQDQVVTIPSCSLGPSLNGYPISPLISGSVILFKGCFQELGYDMKSSGFFSAPISRGEFDAVAEKDWALAKGLLVWSSETGQFGQQQTQIYSAQVAASQ